MYLTLACIASKKGVDEKVLGMSTTYPDWEDFFEELREKDWLYMEIYNEEGDLEERYERPEDCEHPVMDTIDETPTGYEEQCATCGTCKYTSNCIDKLPF